MVDSVIIERLDGTRYVLETLGIRVLTFNPPSPNMQHTFQQIGKTRALKVETKAQQLTIPLSFNVCALDNYDYELQRLKVLEIFQSYEPFYVYTTRIPYLRWKVVAESFAYSRLNNYWQANNVTVNLVSSDGYAETVQTTLDPFTFDRETWGLGLGEPFVENLTYKFKNGDNIDFVNIGLVPLLSEERPVRMHFNGIVPEKLSIKNKRTNQTWEFTQQLTRKDQLIIEGMVPVLNGKLVFEHCNHSYMDFEIGRNPLEISGTKEFDLSFETRFYY